jgi:ribose 5-phosphate isomerase A
MSRVSNELEKQRAAEASVSLVQDGMMVGLGTGSTVAYLLPALARRGLSIRCVATSPRTEMIARELGLSVEPFGSITRFDISIDGADEVTPDGWLIKGGGAAHTREKIIAAAADRFVVIADSSKTVDALRGPIPVELLEFGLAATMRRLDPIQQRDVPRSPDGGVIADYSGPIDDPATVAAFLSATPGLVDHGLFPPAMVADVFVARGEDVEHRTLR